MRLVMTNELLLICSVIFIFGSVPLAFKIFGKTGLYCMSVVATILANIEVSILVNAFGMEQTLGNVLFAVTFLVTDILSECEGKKAANKAVVLGVFVNLFYLAVSQSWGIFIPSENDVIHSSITAVFGVAPRIVLSSLLAYAVSQFLDVWLYHKWWAFTEKHFSDRRRFLWLRNNGSTLISQIINTVCFNLCAFGGVYNSKTLISIILSSYVIYIFTSLLDTPVVYIARKIHEKRVKMP